MKIKINVTRLFAPVAICLALIVLSLVPIVLPVSIAGAATSSILGIVTDAANPSGLGGVCVTASSTTGGTGGSGVTIGDGSYSITGLSPDTYTVEFDPSCAGPSPDAPQWYSGATSLATAALVPVISGTPTTGINASLSLAAPGSITGTVTDGFNPGGLSGICVNAVSSDAGPGSGSAVTAANGTYTIAGLVPDSYTVSFDPTCAGHNASNDVAQTYGSAVSVVAGEATPNINALLATNPGTATTTVVSSSANPGATGTSITYFATVTPTDNGGTVAFSDSGQPIGACSAQPVVATVASCTQFYAGSGSHAISAAYTGDDNFAPSTSSNFDEMVQTSSPPPTPSNPSPTATDLTSSANPATLGYVSYSAVVSPTDNSGTVSFFDASLPIPGCHGVALTSGIATCLVLEPSAGSHTISASFSGSPAYDPSNSSILDEAVLFTTATTMASSYNPAADNAGIKFTSTTSPSPDGGTMRFEINGATISGCARKDVTNGESRCQVKDLHPGNYTVTAVYSGDSKFQTSTSTVYSEKVLLNSVVTVNANKYVAKRGKVVHFVAKVASKYGTGFITFANNGRIIRACKKVQLQFGVGKCSVRFSVGKHIVSVAFSGNALFGPSYNGLLEIIKK